MKEGGIYGDTNSYPPEKDKQINNKNAKNSF